MNLPTIAEELAHNIANGSRGSRGGKSNQHDESDNEDLVSGDTISPKNPGDDVQAPVISFALIEQLVYQVVESNRLDIFQYARKEIIFNERDVLQTVTKKNIQKIKEAITTKVMIGAPSTPETVHQVPVIGHLSPKSHPTS